MLVRKRGGTHDAMGKSMEYHGKSPALADGNSQFDRNAWERCRIEVDARR